MNRRTKKRKLQTIEEVEIKIEERLEESKPIIAVDENENFRFFNLDYFDILKMILNNIRIPDIKNVALVNKKFYQILSSLRKNKTYLYIRNLKNDDLPGLLKTKRQFNEIFFYGNQDPQHVTQILKTFGKDLQILKFAKSNLNFFEVQNKSQSPASLSDWLCQTRNITELDLINIKIENSPNDDRLRILLKSLAKLRCYDSFLNVIVSPSLVKLELQVIDTIDFQKLNNIQEFLDISFRLKHFDLRVFCNIDDKEVQNVSLKLDHIKLDKLIIREFRFNPRHVADILNKQKNLMHLHLEDGTLSNDDSDAQYLRQLQIVFDQILDLKQLNKLTIEMPSVDFLIRLQNLPNLKRLSIINFPQIDLKFLKEISNSKLEKFCIENIEFGKKSIEKNDVEFLHGIIKNVKTLKIDTTPLNIVKLLLNEIPNLKVLKMIRNSEIAKKCKQMSGENVELPITNLEKIICDTEDFKMRILPIIRSSPQLMHVKIYWDNKNTPFMEMVFDILESCSDIKLIEFVHGALFVKEDIFPSYKTHLSFSCKNMNFERIVLRKEAKVIYRRVN
ncbi:hypothetical protein PVAND_014014 [Polypedilum vanderplanki]|uniref:F-box domain-containing protein n=1 Tax=Polypedilum vanderplanki TaxID=319348 RepID=A0A9J6CRH3_POLVA|nr:hypothetical protein PVAND_014014 [Polypedilum vanderplanki]